MYIGSYAIDDTLYMWCNTHNAATSAETDADAAPTFRIYKGGTTTPVQTGTFTLKDSANTVGFYEASVVLSAANGFAANTQYVVRKNAVVNSITGDELDDFQIGAKVTATGVSLTAQNLADLATNIANTLDTRLGTGTVSVNQDYPTAGNLQYTGIQGAQVRAYLKSDYNAGRRSESYRKGETSTDVNGDWRDSMMLDPATYIIEFHKAGYSGPDTVEVTVS